MTNWEIFIFTSLCWGMICVAQFLYLYGKGYKDGQDSTLTKWENAYKMWYSEGYEDGKEGRKKCVK